MERTDRRNLLLSGVDVTVIGHGGTTIDRLRSRLPYNRVQNADVVYLHVGENDYERKSPEDAALDIMRLAVDLVYVHRVRTVTIGELAKFPVHQSNWCILVNRCLRRLVAERPGHRIRLWRQRRALYSRPSSLFARDGVHVDRRHMHAYFNTVRFAVMSAVRHQ